MRRLRRVLRRMWWLIRPLVVIRDDPERDEW
jgi:hypothetical protein